jgi:hypothetical protein
MFYRFYADHTKGAVAFGGKTFLEKSFSPKPPRIIGFVSKNSCLFTKPILFLLGKNGILMLKYSYKRN